MKLGVISVILFWLAAALQQSWSIPTTPLGISVNFLLTSACCLAMFGNRHTALLLGFVCGALESAIVGVNAWQLVLSRLLGCLVIGLITEMRFQHNGAVAGVATFLASLFSGTIYAFISAPPNLTQALLATIGGAVYNGVLAVLVGTLLVKLIDARKPL